MGCTSSALAIGPSDIMAASATNPANAINLFLSEIIYNEDTPLEVTRESLDDFQTLCNQLQLSEEDSKSTINHYAKLLARDDHAENFNLSLEISMGIGRVLCLSDASLIFFKCLKENTPASYFGLLEKLKQLCAPSGKHLFLQSHHVDAVVRILNAQNDIDRQCFNISILLSSYLENQTTSIDAVIKSLLAKNLPAVAEQAIRANLVHHNLKHAAEIRVRSTHTIDEAGIFRIEVDPEEIQQIVPSHESSSNFGSFFLSSIDRYSNDISDESVNNLALFLRSLSRFAIECHDYIYERSPNYGSVEQATAARLTEWLTDEQLGLPSLSPLLESLLALINDYIITLGTTMIFSFKETMDLSELFILFEAAADSSIDVDSPNAAFFKMLKSIAFITGVCDKAPIAIFKVVKMQADDNRTNSLSNLQSNLPYRPLIQSFFEQIGYGFQPYYKYKDIKYSHQAFLMAVVSHICMRAEFSKVSKFRRFISSCQNAHKMGFDEPGGFFNFFEEKFIEHNIATLVEEFFLSKELIDKEKSFCTSVVSDLRFKQERVTDSNPDAEQPLIDPEVLLVDANNLGAFYRFYISLSPSEKILVTKELTLNVILQAGAMYLEKPEVYLCAESSSRMLDAQSTQTVMSARPSHVNGTEYSIKARRNISEPASFLRRFYSGGLEVERSEAELNSSNDSLSYR